jgi:prepilin-type processing-associated H-X9-DG protein
MIASNKDIGGFMALLSGSPIPIVSGAPGRKNALILNDASIYISWGDKYASSIKSPVISKWTADGKWYWAQPLNPVTNGLGTNAEIVSYCVILGVEPNDHPETTPIAFSRGLKEDGTWDEAYGLYGSKGGYIAFCDGHVKWFDGDKPVKLLKYDQSGYTSNILETQPPNVQFSCGYKVNANLLRCKRYIDYFKQSW